MAHVCFTRSLFRNRTTALTQTAEVFRAVDSFFFFWQKVKAGLFAGNVMKRTAVCLHELLKPRRLGHAPIKHKSSFFLLSSEAKRCWQLNDIKTIDLQL